MVYIFEKELEMIRKIGAYTEEIQERWDFKEMTKLLAFLCPKSASDSNPFITKLLRSLQLNLHAEQLICLLRKLDLDQDGDVGTRDWTIFFHPEQNSN